MRRAIDSFDIVRLRAVTTPRSTSETQRLGGRVKLESFSVENYRSITQARQIPLSSSTVLIGPNNEGKSNVLRALSAAMFALSRYSRGGRVTPAARLAARREGDFTRLFDWDRDFPLSLRNSRTQRSTKITLDFSLSDDEVAEFKTEIKSNLNGTLPVCITFTEDDFDVRIVKQGRGSASLNAKNNRIAKFLAERIQFQYIPAVRTAQQASQIVSNIIADQLSELENRPEYEAALKSIKDLQRPILESFSKRTTETLKAFLPTMRSVTFSVNDEQRYSALRQSISIEVDDGVVTSLEAKGDGVQSLVALGLRRHLLEENREQRTYIFAVEEPEAHLHPDAIHELREVLSDVSRVDQLIITTHSGILSNRSSISSNIIVHRSKAAPARSLAEIRAALGIRSRDNLINAELVLLVEGDDDKLALRALLAHTSKALDDAFASGRLILDSLDGAGSLGAKIGLYRGILCGIHCFLDHDEAGRTAVEKAVHASLIDVADFNFALLSGKADTELEDLLNPEVYSEKLKAVFGVDLSVIKPRNRKAKWSARMSDVFSQCGKPFDDLTKQRIKFVVAEAVAGAPGNAMAEHSQAILNSLVSALLAKLDNNEAKL